MLERLGKEELMTDRVVVVLAESDVEGWPMDAETQLKDGSHSREFEHLYAYAVEYPKLRKVASELEDSLRLLLGGQSPTLRFHDINARAKEPASYQKKYLKPQYCKDGRRIDDCIAARIIVYTMPARNRVVDIIRNTFVIVEGEDIDKDDTDDRLPRDDRRGYSSHHFVVEGVKSKEFLVSGQLSSYFERHKTAEIQVRTVAGHAWAEYEHDARYKPERYGALDSNTRSFVDHLFRQAARDRQNLDESFYKIEQYLEMGSRRSPEEPAPVEVVSGTTSITVHSIGKLLYERYPDDKAASDAGLEFACQLCEAMGISTIEELTAVLDDGDIAQVRGLMAYSIPLTSVRLLDDELLALYGRDYISRTADIGKKPFVGTRKEKLEARYRALQGKYLIYALQGEVVPNSLQGRGITAARGFRELLNIVVTTRGGVIEVPGYVSIGGPLPLGARPKKVVVDNETMWVHGNLGRDEAETAMRLLLEGFPELDEVTVWRAGDLILPASDGD